MKILISFLSLILLTACGFHPIYGVNKYTPVGVEKTLEQIEISNISNREGQYLRNSLIDKFYSHKRPENPIYYLDVKSVHEALTNLDITKSADATRGQLKLSTKIQLINKKTGKTVLERDIRSITSYNILSSKFSTRVSEDNARLNALDDISRQIEQQITLYFKR
ncbi:MAG: hypothetical protein KAJ86_05970 [Alphaproteobacteria bacterium]|nr:hypothetical protein [Alphaproteobacteria bacterium]